jgi:hypothetical protein
VITLTKETKMQGTVANSDHYATGPSSKRFRRT